MSPQAQQTACPRCGLSIQNDGSLGGQVVSCPSCQQQFQMPIVLAVAKAKPPIATAANGLPTVSDQATTGGQSRVRIRPRLSGLAVKSLLFGLPGLFCFPLGIVSIVLGLQAYGRIKDKRNHETGKGIALSGVGLGVASILLVAIVAAVSPNNDVANRSEATASIDWREVDSSSEARTETWQLILKQEQRKVAEDAAARAGIAPPRIVQNNESFFDVEHLGNQVYRVTGEYSEQLSVGLRGAMGDPNYRSKSDRKVFEAKVQQVAKGEWQIIDFDAELKSESTIRESATTPTISDVRYGLSESERKRFFRRYVLIEDLHGVHSPESQAAKQRLCNEYGITQQQAIQIAVESHEKNWPLP